MPHTPAIPRSRPESLPPRPTLLLLTALHTAPALAGDGAEAKLVLFGSLNAGPPSSFASAGLKAAPISGLDRDGPVILLDAGAGSYRDRGTGRSLGGVSAAFKALAGWQWAVPGGIAALYAGPEVVGHAPLTGGRFGRRESGVGGRVLAEAWIEPWPATMASLVASAGNLDRAYWARARAGWRPLDGWPFLGPEITARGETGEREARLGLHATGLRLGSFGFDLAGGASRTGGVLPPGAARLGAYGTLTTYRRF